VINGRHTTPITPPRGVPVRGEVGDNQAVSAPNGLRHPALSDTLLHFTSRARQRPDLPGTIAYQWGRSGRLEEIIRTERIQSFSTH